jgi:hypothetical protein
MKLTLYAVRTLDDHIAIGIYYSRSAEELAIMVDETIIDPHQCEYQKISATFAIVAPEHVDWKIPDNPEDPMNAEDIEGLMEFRSTWATYQFDNKKWQPLGPEMDSYNARPRGQKIHTFPHEKMPELIRALRSETDET